MFARAAEYLPALPSLSIERTWTGFRSATPDKLPLIGPSAEDETVFLATGHEGLGITTSLGNRATPGRPHRWQNSGHSDRALLALAEHWRWSCLQATLPIPGR